MPRGRENKLVGLHGGQQRRDREDDYGKISVLELPNERTDGPLQIANVFATDEDVQQALLPLHHR